jgi:glucosyl-3-phosphoglycerate synthase
MILVRRGESTTMVTRIKTFDPYSWNLETALALKGSTTVSVCIPCKNEAATIGDLIQMIEPDLLGTLVDELIVLDDGSTDETAYIAAQGGARVVSIEEIHDRYGPGAGKGNALWGSLVASSGDIVVWVDGDITSFARDWIVKLVTPLLLDAELGLVKASYERPSHLGGGGRTTELVARPLLSLFYPELTQMHQPLAGEFAGRRSMLENIPFSTGWGVEIGMIIDMAQAFGYESLGQVDLGIRLHRHHKLEVLAIQAAEVAATLLDRIDQPVMFAQENPTLFRINGDEVILNLGVRPPLAQMKRERT